MKMEEKDLNELHNYINTYGKDQVYNFLMESSYYGTNHYNLHGPGTTHKWNGARGVKGLASLGVSFLISPWLPALLLLGAANARARQIWENKNSWTRQLFDPTNWAEYLGTGNYIPDGRKGKDSWWDDDDKPASLIASIRKKRKNAKDNNTGDDYDADSDNDFQNTDDTDYSEAPSDTTTRKPVRRSADTGKSTYDPKAKGFDPDEYKYFFNVENIEEITPDKIESLVFKDWWIYFDNGEVIKFRTASEKDAASYGNIWVTRDEIKEGYELYNEALKRNNEAHLWRGYFSEGEILYCVAKDKKTAKEFLDSLMKGLTKAQNTYYPTAFVNLPPVKKSSIKKIEELGEKTVEAPTRFKVMSNKPAIDDAETEKLEGKLMYSSADTTECVLSLGALCKIHTAVPFKDLEAGKALGEKLFKSGISNPVIEKWLLTTQSGNDTDIFFKTKTVDGDEYIMVASDKHEAADMTQKLWMLKTLANEEILHGNISNEALRTLQTNWSRLKNSEIRIKEASTRKNSPIELKIPKQGNATLLGVKTVNAKGKPIKVSTPFNIMQ